MPRVPTAGAPQRIQYTPQSSPGQTLAAFSSAAKVFDQGAQIALDAKQRLDEARRNDLFIEKSSEFNQGLNELGRIHTDTVIHRLAAEELLQDITDNTKSRRVRAMLKERGTLAIDSANYTLSTRLDKEQRAAARLMIYDGTEETANSVAQHDLAKEPSESERKMLEQIANINMAVGTGTLTEAMGIEQINALHVGVQTNRILILLQRAVKSPEDA